MISTSFADIFKNNALKNGLLPISVSGDIHQKLSILALRLPAREWTIDLQSQTIRLPDGSIIDFPIDGFSKACLLAGTDELSYLLRFDKQIASFEASHEDQ